MRRNDKQMDRFGKLPAERARQFILSENTPSEVWDAYRRMLWNLSRSLQPDASLTAVVTSCALSEGKSTTCVNLAVAAAESGERTLLIDCDMRRPSLHLLLRLGNEAGLSSFLSGSVTDIRKLLNTGVREGLDVITAGPVQKEPAALLFGSGTDAVLSFAKAHYDRVFLDTPPVKAVSDAFLLNGRTDGLIFVVREGKTRREDLRKCLSDAKLANGNVLGIIRTNCKKK